MKKLDMFSRFEDSLLKIWVILSIIVFPVALVYLIDKLLLESFLKQYEWFIGYPIRVACWAAIFFACIIFAITCGAMLENVLDGIGKIFGKKPLGKIIRLHKEEQFEQEIQTEERKKERFLNQSGDNKLYLLWERQSTYFESLKREIKKLRLLVLILFIILLAIKFLS